MGTTTTREIIAKAKATYPDLGTDGFGKGLDEVFNHKQIETALAFLRLCQPTKSKGQITTGTYPLKHQIGYWGRSLGLAPYITTGATIIAAHALGFAIKRSGCGCCAGIGINMHSLNRVTERMEKLRRYTNYAA